MRTRTATESRSIRRKRGGAGIVRSLACLPALVVIMVAYVGAAEGDAPGRVRDESCSSFATASLERGSSPAAGLVGEKVTFAFSPLLQEGTVNSEGLAGRPFLLVFWWTRCQICRGKLSVLEDLQAKYGTRGLKIVTAAFDPEPDRVAAILPESGRASWMNCLNADGAVARFGRTNGVSSVPTWWLIDKTGVIRYRDAFQMTEKKIKVLLDSEEVP